jgi:hypothetical protein
MPDPEWAAYKLPFGVRQGSRNSAPHGSFCPSVFTRACEGLRMLFKLLFLPEVFGLKVTGLMLLLARRPAPKGIVFTRGQNFCIAKASIRSPSQARVKTEGQKLPFGALHRLGFRAQSNRANVTAFYPNKVQGEWQPHFCFYLRFSGSK